MSQVTVNCLSNHLEDFVLFVSQLGHHKNLCHCENLKVFSPCFVKSVTILLSNHLKNSSSQVIMFCHLRAVPLFAIIVQLVTSNLVFFKKTINFNIFYRLDYIYFWKILSNNFFCSDFTTKTSLCKNFTLQKWLLWNRRSCTMEIYFGIRFGFDLFWSSQITGRQQAMYYWKIWVGFWYEQCV